MNLPWTACGFVCNVSISLSFPAPASSTDLNSNNDKTWKSDSYDRIASNNANSLLQVRNVFWVSGGAETRYKKYSCKNPCKTKSYETTRWFHMILSCKDSCTNTFCTLSPFLGTRPSCLPSPGRPLFCTDDRNSNLRLGLPGSPVKNSVKHYNCLIWRLKWLLIIMVSLFWRETNSHYWCKKNDLWKANVAKKKFKIVPNILRYGITTEQRLRSLFLTKHLQDEIRCFRNSEWKVAEAWGLKFRCVSADGLDGKRVR